MGQTGDSFNDVVTALLKKVKELQSDPQDPTRNQITTCEPHEEVSTYE